MKGLLQVREIARSERARDALYNQVNKIPTYRKHRQNMRPWDRSLPPMVEQEMVKRQMWELFPPSRVKIIGTLILCLIGVVFAAILPALVNHKRIEIMWRDMDKPTIVYHDGSVLFAVWIVVHICTALTWWFVWLARGFENHLKIMAGLSLLLFLECIWLDVVFYTQRLDTTLAIWIAATAIILITQILMIVDKIEIGAIFLIPHLACSAAIIVYIIAFLILHGKSWGISQFTLDQRDKFFQLSEFISSATSSS